MPMEYGRPRGCARKHTGPRISEVLEWKQIHRPPTDLSMTIRHYCSTECGCYQLGTEADAENRRTTVEVLLDPVNLAAEPRESLTVVDAHRTTHDNEKVCVTRRRNRVPQVDRVFSHPIPVRAQIGANLARSLMGNMCNYSNVKA